MKVTIDIDCTPAEARHFFGLPDVEPMQRAMMEQLQKQMQDQMSKLNPEELMKSWLTPGLGDFSKFQQAMWSTASGKKTD